MTSHTHVNKQDYETLAEKSVDLTHGIRISAGARIDRIPCWPHRFSLFVIVGASYFFTFVDLYLLGSVLPSVASTFHGSAVNAVSVSLIAYVIGALLIGVASDRFGRRNALLLSVVLLSFGALGSALSANLLMFLVFRFIGSCGMGAQMSVATTYLSEIAPSAGRGKYASWAAFAAYCGAGVTPFLALLLVPHVAAGWRVMLAIPVLSLLTTGIGMRYLVESPRWLEQQGRIEEAEAIVDRMERLALARLGTDALPAPRTEHAPGADPAAQKPFKTLLRKPYNVYIVLFFFIFFFDFFMSYSVTGVGISALYNSGYSITKSIMLTLGSGVGGIVGALLAPYVADRLPRKVAPAVATFVLAIVMLVLALHANDWLVFTVFTLVNFQAGLFFPLVYLAAAEHFPTAIRNSAMSLTEGVAHVGGAVGPQVTLALVAGFGLAGFWLASAVSLLLCGTLILFVRNTTRRPLVDLGGDAVPGRPARTRGTVRL